MKRTGRWVVILTEKEREAVDEALEFTERTRTLTQTGYRAWRKIKFDCKEEMR